MYITEILKQILWNIKTNVLVTVLNVKMKIVRIVLVKTVVAITVTANLNPLELNRLKNNLTIRDFVN